MRYFTLFTESNHTINEQALKDRLQTIAKEKEIPGLGDVSKELNLPENMITIIETINISISKITKR